MSKKSWPNLYNNLIYKIEQGQTVAYLLTVMSMIGILSPIEKFKNIVFYLLCIKVMFYSVYRKIDADYQFIYCFHVKW